MNLGLVSQLEKKKIKKKKKKKKKEEEEEEEEEKKDRKKWKQKTQCSKNAAGAKAMKTRKT